MERRGHGLSVARAAKFLDGLLLLTLDRVIDVEDLERLLLGVGEVVDADDDLLLRVHGALVGVGRVHDLALREPGLDRLDHAPQGVDAAEVVEAPALHFRRQLLDEVGTAERVDGVGYPRLVSDHLLRAERELDREVRRERQRLVERVGVERVRAAEDAGERLDRRAHDVVVGLLGGQRAAGRLGVEAAHP